MVILETFYMIDIPTDSEELANLIYTHSYDWTVVLDFIVSVSKAKHIIINKKEVAELIQKMIGGVE